MCICYLYFSLPQNALNQIFLVTFGHVGLIVFLFFNKTLVWEGAATHWFGRRGLLIFVSPPAFHLFLARSLSKAHTCKQTFRSTRLDSLQLLQIRTDMWRRTQASRWTAGLLSPGCNATVLRTWGSLSHSGDKSTPSSAVKPPWCAPKHCASFASLSLEF